MPRDRSAESSPSGEGRGSTRRSRGPNSFPELEATTSAIASSASAGRCGRRFESAATVSASRRMRAPTGISAPRSPSGYPLPSHHSWWCLRRGARSSRCGMPRTRSSERCGWRWTRFRTEGVSAGAGFLPGVLGQPDHAHVRQDRGEAQLRALGLGQPQLPAQLRGQYGDHRAVILEIALGRGHDPGESLQEASVERPA
jgi:hypothetical protein